MEALAAKAIIVVVFLHVHLTQVGKDLRKENIEDIEIDVSTDNEYFKLFYFYRIKQIYEIY